MQYSDVISKRNKKKETKKKTDTQLLQQDITDLGVKTLQSMWEKQTITSQKWT